MQFKDYYEILGVDRNSTKPEIKKAFRRLARKYHPDVSKEKDAEERFKEVNEAYEVLGDDEKRASYDQLGANWRNGQSFDPPPGWDSGFDFGQFSSSRGGSGFSDFFESMFGGGFGGHQGNFHQRHQRQRQAPAQTANLTVNLEDVYHGGHARVQLANGKHVDVKIPKGIQEGKKIRLPGKASTGGDLLLKIHIRPHPRYSRDHTNLTLTLPIAPWEAALGATIEVQTLAGKLKLKIPPGSQSGKKMRLRGKGLPGKPAGDLFIQLQIHVPPAENEEQRAFYQEMANQFDWEPR